MGQLRPAAPQGTVPCLRSVSAGVARLQQERRSSSRRSAPMLLLFSVTLAAVTVANSRVLVAASEFAPTDFFNPTTDCVADCRAGQYKENCVGSDSLGYCADCSNAPEGFYYTGQGAPNGDDCPYSACRTCGTGEYLSGCEGTSEGTCVVCTTAMVGFHYTGDGGLADECPIAACSNAPNNTNSTYFYTDDGTDEACLSSEACEYGSSDCSYERCEDFTVCPDGFFLEGCGGNSSGICSPCSNDFSTVTDDNTEANTFFDVYYTGPGSTADSQSCPLSLCTFDCPAGSYRAGCGGANSGWCEPCTLVDSDPYDGAGEYFVSWSTTEHAYCENWNHEFHLLGIFNTSASCREFCEPSAECSTCTFVCRTDQNIQGGTFRALRLCGDAVADSSDGCGSFIDHFSSPLGQDACPTATCVADCGVGEYRSGCGDGGTSAGTCEPCTNAPSLRADGAAQYMYVSSGGFENTCAFQLACPAGKYSNVTVSHANNTDLAIDQVCLDCPIGRFGASEGATTNACDGPCDPGYHCPAGSTSPTMEPCAPTTVADETRSAGYFCANGFRQQVPPGHYSTPDDGPSQHRTDHDVCAPGTFCQSGVQHLCPEGTYGETWGLQTEGCSSPCHSSTYCPEGSVLPTKCPPGFYCPSGRELIACPPGTYGGSSGLSQATCNGPCALGHYCPSASTSPTEVECPAGTFGQSTGITIAACSGPCPKGYFCPNATADPYSHECAELAIAERILNDGEVILNGDLDATAIANGAASVFCPEGSAEPVKASSGYFTAGGNPRVRTTQQICPPGSYCVDGLRYPCPVGTYESEAGASARCKTLCPVGTYCPEGSSEPISCPAGTYGAAEGLTNESCSGPCAAGYYCPAASTSEIQVPCPAGTAGESTGLGSVEDCGQLTEGTACAGSGYCLSEPCEAGYYCPAGSTSRREHPCGGAHVFCPEGSFLPTPVSEGFYTINDRTPGDISSAAGAGALRTAQKQCEPGYYCVGGLKFACPAGKYGSEYGLSSQECSGLCTAGYFCTAASVVADPMPCLPGRYGIPGMTNPQCAGGCEAGHYCPAATVDMLACGSSSVYCPALSVAPVEATSGYYTTPQDGDVTLRTGQELCPKGHYCVDGSIFICPAGKFGARVGLASAECSGNCKMGHYCPAGSTSATEKPCPIGTYGEVEGLTNASCSGLCKTNNYCARGTVNQFAHPV